MPRCAPQVSGTTPIWRLPGMGFLGGRDSQLWYACPTSREHLEHPHTILVIDRAEVRAGEQLLRIEHCRAGVVEASLPLADVDVGDTALAQHCQHLWIVDRL